MAKRKAKELETGLPAEEPRRSNRRKTILEEREARVAPEIQPASVQPRKKAAKKEKLQEEKVNGVDDDANRVEDKSVRSLPFRSN